MTAEPKITYTQGETPICVARFNLAVDRKFKRDNQPSADFISCVCMGKSAETIEKLCHKGTKLTTRGHIQTGSYTNRDGQKVYTTDVMIDEWEFAESKAASQQNQVSVPQSQPVAPQSVPQQPVAQPTAPQQQYNQPVAQQAQQMAYTAPPTPTPQYAPNDPNDFMNIPNGTADELPFH